MGVKRKKKRAIIIYIIVSILLVYGLVFATSPNLFVRNTACLWILGWIYLFIFIYGIAGNKVIEAIKQQDSGLGFLVFLAVISGLIVWVLPFQYKQIVFTNTCEKYMLQSDKITIEPLNEKNVNSGGYGVCIEGIILNGEDYNLYNIPLTEGWEFVDGRPYTDRVGSEQLIIEIGEGNKYNLLVRKNNSAGKIRIYIGEDSKVFDLYSRDTVNRESLNLSSIFEDEMNERMIGKEIIYYICYYIIIFILLTTAYAYYLLYRKKRAGE